jgi:hypothetical protein
VVAASAAAFGPLHLDTVQAHGHFADTLGTAGDAAGARDLFTWVVEQLIAQRGPYHKITLLAQVPQAYWTAAAGNSQKGVHLLLRTLVRIRNSLGKNDPLVAQFEAALDGIRGSGGPAKGGGGKPGKKKRKR